jgi:NAD(P)-dependent dehydrogenase (short-subunit alcohol dehydrogenase family)
VNVDNQFGANMSNVAVSAAIAGRNSTVNVASAISNASGNAVLTYTDASTSTTSLTDTLTFTAASGVTDTASVTYTSLAGLGVSTVLATTSQTSATTGADLTVISPFDIAAGSDGVEAGAETIWVGHAEPWKKIPGIETIANLPQVTLVPLDLTNGRSVSELAGAIGGKVDIVMNNAEVHRAFGISSRRGTDVAKAEMDINYFGLLRLSQEFGPALKGRAADGTACATAWVNLLSIFALSNFPLHGTFSASKAAAHSLSQCLRAEMRHAGIRIINVFPGPIDDEWNQNMPPPKVSPEALASSIIKALRDGVEDVYPGDVAQEWLARWRDNPKVLERELAAGGG